MQRILRTIEQICLAHPLDQTESAMADLAGPRKINFVCMNLYMQFVYKLAQWFPTRGPRAKSGPPSLKMWPAALDKLKKIKELNHRVFLTFNLFYLISIFDKHYAM